MKLARVYQGRVSACANKLQCKPATLLNRIKPVVKKFFREPCFDYNRFVERKRYVNYVGTGTVEERNDDWPVRRYEEDVEQPLCNLEVILDGMFRQSLLTKEETAFLRMFYMRKLVTGTHLVSCIDRAESFSARLLETTDSHIIPVIGMMFFWDTEESYKKYCQQPERSKYLEGYNNHALVCVMDAKHYRRSVKYSKFDPYVMKSSQNRSSVINPPKALVDGKTMLCDASTGKVEIYEDTEDWQTHMTDTGVFFSATSLPIHPVNLDNVYRASICWYPAFTVSAS